jgi:hypothetical protein
MKFVRKILVLSALAASLAGCATQQGQQEQGGMIVGCLLGGVLGSQVGQGS